MILTGFSGHSAAAAYNFLFLLSFVLSGWAVYRLARLFPVSRPAAFLAGLLFAFSPYRLSNLDLLNQLQTQFLPLGLFFGIRYVRKARTRDLVGTMGALTAQAAQPAFLGQAESLRTIPSTYT